MATLPKPLNPADASSKPKPQATTRRPPSEISVSASEAKTHLLQLLKDVDAKRQPVVITRRGRAVARLVPVDAQQPRDIFGYMKGTIKITGDIVSPEPDAWEAMS